MAIDRKPGEIKPSIHFLWIGPPPENDNTTGVKQIANAISNPTEFYCLNQHVEYYQALFRRDSISVKSVEGVLQKEETNLNLHQEAKQVFQILNNVLKDTRRNKILDRVAFKDLFSLFLLAAKGGYVSDIGIYPVSNAKESDVLSKGWLQLPESQDFSYPISNEGCVECWMLFAPDKEHPKSLRCLRDYLQGWEKAQLPLNDSKQWVGENEYPYQLHKNIGNLIIDTIQIEEMKETDAWTFELNVSTNTARFRNSPLVKYYGNSWKHPEENAFGLSQSIRWLTKDDVKPSLDVSEKQINKFTHQLKDAIHFGIQKIRSLDSNTKSDLLKKLNTFELFLADESKSSYKSILNFLVDLQNHATLKPQGCCCFFRTINPIDLLIVQMINRITNNFRNRTEAVTQMTDLISKHSQLNPVEFRI